VCERVFAYVCARVCEKESVLASVGDWECVFVGKKSVCVFVSCDYVYMRVRLSAYCKSVR
jgi:hypothetical protein